MTFTFTQILVTAVALLTFPVQGQLDCESRTERADAYEKCFNDQGLEAPALFDGYRNAPASESMDEIPVEKMFALHGQQFCRNITDLRTAVKCAYEIDTSCSSGFVKLVMPTPDAIASTMVPLCQHLPNISFSCAEMKQNSEYGECVSKDVQAIADRMQEGTSISEVICMFMDLMAECLKKTYKSCGCTTAKVYSDLAYDAYSPPGCNRDIVQRVQCNPQNHDAFVDDGLDSGSMLTASLALLAVTTLLVTNVVF